MPRLHTLRLALVAIGLSSGALACDASPSGPPSGYGGGPIQWWLPTEENVANKEFGTFEFSQLPPPAGREAFQLPGLPKPGETGEITDANGGSGAGTTGTKGVGESTTTGLNPLSRSHRPVPEGSNLDLEIRAYPSPSPATR